ncbi:metalloprotease, partial [Tothia fuscella]
QIRAQAEIMNSTYLGSGFQFQLLGVDRTTNDTWALEYQPNSAVERTMKTALRRGTYATLNHYYLSDLTDSPFGALGICNFPERNLTSNIQIDDGCVIDSNTMPGGSNSLYNLGYTSTHETGHWMGIYHVFNRRSCDDGDGIVDTPAQIEPTYGCPESNGTTTKDSCPLDEGKDSIHNYMDYSDDICLNQFTPDQKAMMREIFPIFRAGRDVRN